MRIPAAVVAAFRTKIERGTSVENALGTAIREYLVGLEMMRGLEDHIALMVQVTQAPTLRAESAALLAYFGIAAHRLPHTHPNEPNRRKRQ